MAEDTRCARCRGIGWINENGQSTDSVRCPTCKGVGRELVEDDE